MTLQKSYIINWVSVKIKTTTTTTKKHKQQHPPKKKQTQKNLEEENNRSKSHGHIMTSKIKYTNTASLA